MNYVLKCLFLGLFLILGLVGFLYVVKMNSIEKKYLLLDELNPDNIKKLNNYLNELGAYIEDDEIKRANGQILYYKTVVWERPHYSKYPNGYCHNGEYYRFNRPGDTTIGEGRTRRYMHYDDARSSYSLDAKLPLESVGYKKLNISGVSTRDLNIILGGILRREKETEVTVDDNQD